MGAENEKNILVLSMSTLNRIDASHYYAEKNPGVYIVLRGIQDYYPAYHF